MQIAAQRLASHLQQQVHSLYVLMGDEPLLLQEASDALRAAARERGFDECSTFTVAGVRFDWSEVLAQAGSQSLFAQSQMLQVRIPSGKPGKDGALALQQLAEQSKDNASTIVVVSLPRLDKTTRAAPWCVALEQAGVTIQIESIERSNLPEWIAQRLAGQAQRVASGEPGQLTLQFFADQVEGNLLAAHQEIQKLALLYGPGELSFEQIERAVLNVARYDVFKLSQAVLGGHATRVQRMLDGLQSEAQAEVLVHYALSEEIRALKRVKDSLASGKPLPVALREHRVWGARERSFERVLPRLTARHLAELLEAAHQVDGIVKGLPQAGWPADAWQALHRLALQLCLLCAGRDTRTRHLIWDGEI